MSRADRLDNAWGVTPEVDEARLGAVRPLVFVGAFALAMPGIAIPGIGLPVSEVGGLMLAGLVLINRPVARVPLWLPLLLAGVLGMLILSALLNDIDGTRRLVHVAVWALLAYGIASGRLHTLSTMRGVAIGLVVATGLSLGGVLGDRAGYEGRLTGLFADPNVAGYYQIVLGSAAVTFLATRLRRAGFVALLLAGIYRTLSRTSLLAVLVAGFWIALGRRLGRVGAVAVVAAMVYLVDNLPAEVRLFGPFSQREGSDALRDRIIAEENSVISTTPWFGNGPGTSRVLIDGQEFFFHNSYLGARNEGGWPVLILLIVLLVLAFWSLFHPDVRRHPRTAWVQLPLIATLVCAVSLGEVLLELPAAVAIGLAVAQRTHLAMDPYLGRVGLSARQLRRMDAEVTAPDADGPEHGLHGTAMPSDPGRADRGSTRAHTIRSRFPENPRSPRPRGRR